MLPSCQCFFPLPVVQETPLLSTFSIVSPVQKNLKVLVVPNPPVQMLSSPHRHLNFELPFFKPLIQLHRYVSFSPQTDTKLHCSCYTHLFESLHLFCSFGISSLILAFFFYLSSVFASSVCC